jgi:hypothetical protein
LSRPVTSYLVSFTPLPILCRSRLLPDCPRECYGLAALVTPDTSITTTTTTTTTRRHRQFTMASHGDPEIFAAPGPARLQQQHPLTTEEKLEQSSFDIEASPKSSEYGVDLGKAQPEPAEQETGFLARMREWEAAMDRKLGIESQAIERKQPEDRVDLTWKDSLTMASLWASGTMNLSCFATGFLGWKFGLDLK